MFSVRQKRAIAEQVQTILRATNHPELPASGDIQFELSVKGEAPWSYCIIQNNSAVTNPGINPHNERMDTNAPI